MKTIKKVGILFLLCLTMLSVSFGATEVISSCPTSITNDTTYMLAPDFFADATPCFDLDNTNSVVIDGNYTDFRDSAGDIVIEVNSDNVFLDIQNIIHDELEIDILGIDNMINIHDNVIYTGYTMLYTGYTSGIPNTNTANFLIRWRPSGTASGTVSNYIDIYENRFLGGTYTPTQRDNQVLFFCYDNYYGLDLDVYSNEMLGWGLASERLQNNGANGVGALGLEHFLFQDNNYVRAYDITQDTVLSLVTSTCDDYSVQSNNLISKATQYDADGDSISDDVVTLSYGGCTLLNDEIPTRKRMYYPEWYETEYETEFVTNTMMVQNVYSNARYVLGKTLTFNATDYFDFDSASNSMIDLYLYPNVNALTLTVVRGLQMGNDNVITGGEATTPPIIKASGTISVVDVGYYGNNWNLIDYYNGLEIDNINFDLDATDNYGLLRKTSSAVDGIGFYMHDSIVDVNFVPSSPTRPLMLVGAMATLEDNTFYLPTSTNMSLLGGGVSSSLGGGHVITGNIFYGGGFIFSYLTDAIGGTNYDSKFIHNSFLQSGTLYAQPFNPTNNAYNLLEEPKLNGSYYYKTTCTNYEFNIGNYYEDWDDSGWYNDSTGDGIHDSYLGIDYINRGEDYLGNPINDYRSIISYPYDFSTQIGTAVNTYETCESFVFNIVSPTTQNYTSGYELTSDWEYIAIAYDDMYCFESLNGFTTIYELVATGENQGVVYDTTDGAGVLNLKCCDTPQCDNIVKEADPVNFCIGDCDLGNLVVSGVETPPEPVYGCTDSGATNYNPSATIDDGSCTYATGDGGDEDQIEGIGSIGNLFSTDYEASGDSIGGLFALASEPIGWLILVGFVFLGLTLLGLIFALVMWMIGG